MQRNTPPPVTVRVQIKAFAPTESTSAAWMIVSRRVVTSRPRRIWFWGDAENVADLEVASLVKEQVLDKGESRKIR